MNRFKYIARWLPLVAFLLGLVNFGLIPSLAEAASPTPFIVAERQGNQIRLYVANLNAIKQAAGNPTEFVTRWNCTTGPDCFGEVSTTEVLWPLQQANTVRFRFDYVDGGTWQEGFADVTVSLADIWPDMQLTASKTNLAVDENATVTVQNPRAGWASYDLSYGDGRPTVGRPGSESSFVVGYDTPTASGTVYPFTLTARAPSGNNDGSWVNVATGSINFTVSNPAPEVAPLTITMTQATNDGRIETNELLTFCTSAQTGEFAMLWVGDWGEFNSGSNNCMDWGYSVAGPQTVSVRVEKPISGAWTKVAEGTIQINVVNPITPPAPVNRPSFTAEANTAWTTGVTDTITIVIANVPEDETAMALTISGVPGYAPFNAWIASSTEVTRTVLSGNRVQLEVPYNVTTAGLVQAKLVLDYNDGVTGWKEEQVENVIFRVSKPKPVLTILVPGTDNNGMRQVGVNTRHQLQVRVDGLSNLPTAQYTLRICGLPNTGNVACHNLTLDPDVSKVQNGDSATFTFPFAFDTLGAQYDLVANLDTPIDGAWQEGYATSTTKVKIVLNVSNLPLIRR